MLKSNSGQLDRLNEKYAGKSKTCSLWRALFFTTAALWLYSLKIFVAILSIVAFSSGEFVSAEDPSHSDSIQFRAEMGLGGYWKVGYPTRTSITITSGTTGIDGLLEIQTFDGDGVPVVYRSDSWTVQLQPKSTQRIEVVAKHGRSNRPITIQIVGIDGSILHKRALHSEERGTAISATQPWVVGIGSDRLELSQGAMKSARGALPEHSTVQLTRAEQLPLSAICYGGVDFLILSSGNVELNHAIHSESAIAIRDWIAQGGRCVLSLGQNAESWLKTPEFTSLVPGTFKEISTDCDPTPLESFLGSQNRLGDLKCCLFTLGSGTVEIESKTKNRSRFPMIARWAYGSGKVHFLAVELDSEQILIWESRPSLLKFLFNEQWEKKDVQTEKRVYLGYDDISGQLNSTLDHFPLLTLGSLATISIIAGLLCLAIGPLDYFLVSQRWRKPGGTWITLLVCSFGSCIFIYGLARRWKPEMPSINSLEVLDIDYQTHTLRGRAFAHCYGGRRGAFDFSAHRRTQGLNASEISTTSKVQLDWFGQPGKGIGGFESTVATDRGMPIYEIDMNNGGTEGIKNENKKTISPKQSLHGIRGVGIPAAGTKSLIATWHEGITLPKETNSLSMVSGSIDLLEGSFENPLDVDLLDALLIYRGRAYTLDTRIRVGQRLSFSAATVPKDITRRLQRRQNVGGEERSTPWNPASIGNLDRLMELISFHESAGSSKYTGLYNRYLGELDCSDVIRLDRAILICELKDSSLLWSMRRNSVPIQATEGQRKTFLRLIIPVSKLKSASPDLSSANPPIDTKP